MLKKADVHMIHDISMKRTLFLSKTAGTAWYTAAHDKTANEASYELVDRDGRVSLRFTESSGFFWLDSTTWTSSNAPDYSLNSLF